MKDIVANQRTVSRWKAALATGALVGALAATTAFGPPSVAFAATTPVIASVTAAAQLQPAKIKDGGARLEARLATEITRLAKQQDRLDKAGALVQRAQKRIDQMKTNGKDTSSLQAALESFNTSLASAQQSHNQAKSILDSHAGFDASNQVTDQAQAKTTVQSAHTALQGAATTLKKGAADLRTALKVVAQSKKKSQ